MEDEGRKWEQEQWESLDLGAGLTPGKGEGERGRTGKKSLRLQCSLETPWSSSWGAPEPRHLMGTLGWAGVSVPVPTVFGPWPGSGGVAAGGFQPAMLPTTTL